MSWTNAELLAAIDADTAPGGLAELAAIGADNQIAERLASQTVTSVKDPTYVKEGMLRKAIIALEVAGGADLATALGTATAVVGAIKTALTTGPAAAATEIFWGYAEIDKPVDGLNVGGSFERAFLDSLVPAVITAPRAAAIKALAETTATKWPGITADIVSDALNTSERRPGGKVVE